MKSLGRAFLIATAALLAGPAVARAGMPMIGLSELAPLRLDAISFFLLGFLSCVALVRWIWNSLTVDFPRLPRLSFGRSVGFVALWGLLFLLVLTMISGARELMTPGAWQKVGLTYKLAEDDPKATAEAEKERDSARLRALDRLRDALWRYAETHEGHFPPDRSTAEIPEDAWRVPDPSGMHYLYLPGRSAGLGADPLAYEPGLFGSERLVLYTNGRIAWRSLDEIRRAIGVGKAR